MVINKTDLVASDVVKKCYQSITPETMGRLCDLCKKQGESRSFERTDFFTSSTYSYLYETGGEES